MLMDAVKYDEVGRRAWSDASSGEPGGSLGTLCLEGIGASVPAINELSCSQRKKPQILDGELLE